MFQIPSSSTAPALRTGLLLLASVLSRPAHAEDPPPVAVTLPEMTISATRLPAPMDQVGSSAQVITAQEIEQKQRRTLAGALMDAPGLNLVQANGPGGQASVFMRGTNANHVKVRIDGMDANDPSSVTGAFDFGQMLTAGIDRIEVLRGPQSGLYGADAIGGVIDITTPRGQGPLTASATMEGGSFGTFNQSGSLQGSTGPFHYALDAGHVRTSNVPITPESLQPPNAPRLGNAFDSMTVATRLGYDISENFDVGLTVRALESDLRYVANPGEERSGTTNRELFTRATAHLVLFGGVLDQTVGAGFTDYRRRDISPDGSVPAEPTVNRGDRVKLDWQGAVRLGPPAKLVLGAEHLLEEIRDSPISASTRTDAGYAELIATSGRFSGSAVVRFDSNSRFGDHATWRLAPVLDVPETGTRFKASGGTGFKGPTLNQLFVSYPSFSFFANPDLKAETSIGYDLGAEQSLFGGRVRLGATYFHNDLDNLITTNDTFSSYVNVAKATTHGIEAFASWQAARALAFRVDWTNTVTKDDTTNQELLRRPRTKLSVNTAWQVTDRLSLSGTVLYVSSRIDGNRDFSVSRMRANGFATADIAAQYKLTQNLTAFGRIDNLLDRRYENPSGFLQPGIAGFAGIRAGL